jgi:hypothetical protein
MILEIDRALVQALLDEPDRGEWAGLIARRRDDQQRAYEKAIGAEVAEWRAWAKSLTCREDLDDVMQRDFLESSLKEAAEKLEGCLERAKAMQRLNEELEEKIAQLQSQLEDADQEMQDALGHQRASGLEQRSMELTEWRKWAGRLTGTSISGPGPDARLRTNLFLELDAWRNGRRKSTKDENFQQLYQDLRAWVEWAKAHTRRDGLNDAEQRKVLDDALEASLGGGPLSENEILAIRRDLKKRGIL